MAVDMGYNTADAFHRTVARLKNQYPHLNIQSTTSDNKLKNDRVDAWANSLKRARVAEAAAAKAKTEGKQAKKVKVAEVKKKADGGEEEDADDQLGEASDGEAVVAVKAEAVEEDNNGDGKVA